MFRRSCGGRIMARDSLWPVSSIPCAAGGTWNLPLHFFLSSMRLDRPIYYVAPGMVMCLPGVGFLARFRGVLADELWREGKSIPGLRSSCGVRCAIYNHFIRNGL